MYGFERDDVVSLGLIKPSESSALPTRLDLITPLLAGLPHIGFSHFSRQKTSGQAIVATQVMAINLPDLLDILAKYVETGPETLAVIIASFLNALVSDASPLGSQEVDSLIALNIQALHLW